MTTAEVLRRAADVIRERGWHRGSYCAQEDGSGPVCALGAIHVVCGGAPYFSVRTDWIASCARRALRTSLDGASVPRWNDQPGRTKEEVIEALEKAAKLAEVAHGV